MGLDRPAARRDLRRRHRPGSLHEAAATVASAVDRGPRARSASIVLAGGRRAALVARRRTSAGSARRSGRSSGSGSPSRSRSTSLSVVARALAWTTVIRQAMPPPHPRRPARLLRVLRRAVRERRAAGTDRRARARRRADAEDAGAEGRVGDARRDGVRAPRLRHRPGDAAGRVSCSTANIPASAKATLLFVIGVGVGLFLFAFVSARRQHRDDGRRARARPAALAMGRHGLGVMRSPLGAAVAILFQTLGWVSRSSPSGRRCAPSTSTRRCRRPASCCC